MVSMAEPESGKGLFGSLEDKYYDFLDWLDEKGVPVYKAVDFLEERNIPTFPIALLLVLLVAAGIVFLLAGILVPATGALTITVQDSSGNPVTGVNVQVLFGNDSLSKTTTSDGTATFSVPLNTELEVSAEKTGYVSGEEFFKLENQTGALSVTIAQEKTFLARTFQFLLPGSNELVTETLQVEFTCSAVSFFETKTTANGFISLENIPSDCGLINVRPIGNFSAQQGSFDALEDEQLKVFLEEQEIGKGSVLVSVRDSEGATLSGMTVNLLLYNTQTGSGVVFASKDTALSGAATFLDVPEGKYFVTVFDPSANFSEFDSSVSGDIKQIVVGSSISFPVVLGKKVVGSLSLVVKDSASLTAVPDALVKIYKAGSFISEQRTDPNGKVEISVGEQVTYDIVVDKQGYLIENISLLPSTETREVLVSKATAENSESLTVTVVDEAGNPVENVRLSLVNAADEKPVGSEKTTGINGVAVFERVKEGSYYVTALKPGFGETASETIQMTARQQNQLEIVLAIGFGNVEVEVFDDKKVPLAGATVSIVDSATGQVLEQGTSGANGEAIFSIRADKIVYAVASAASFLPYTSIPVAVGKDSTRELSLDMRKEITGISLELVGVFAGDGSVADSTVPSLSPGQNFKAKFLLLIPRGASFQQAAAHIRTGGAANNSTNPMEKDAFFISDVRSAFDQVLRGTSFSPPKSFSVDASHFTSSSAKWVEVYFNNPVEGAYEIEVDLAVNQNARPGTVLDLWYRAWGRTGGGFLRFPEDSVLGASESVAEKQGFFAQAKNKKFSVGPSSICFEDFCLSLVVENVIDGLQTSVFDEIPAEIGSKYRLKYSASNISAQVFSGAEFNLLDESDTVLFGAFEASDVEGRTTTGFANAATHTVPVGNISANDSFSGFVEFEAKKDGTAEVVLRVNAGEQGKEVVFERILRVNVAASQEMLVEVVPKTIPPFVKTNMLVNTTTLEEEPLSGVSITVSVNGTVVESGKTNAGGVFAFTLEPQNVGATVKILAEKKSYKPVEITILVSENVIITVPPSINEQLVVGEREQKDITVQLINATQIPLTISEVFASSEFSGFVDFGFDPNLIGTVLDQNVDANTTIRISIARDAEILEPKRIAGGINMVVTNPTIAKKWNSRIPTEVRLGFGEEMDDTKCLEIDPDKWEIITAGEKKTLGFTLRNTCTANGVQVPLSKLSARLNLGSQNNVGSFSAGSALFEDETPVILSTAFKEVAKTVAPAAEESVTVEFTPSDVLSASQELSIEFKGLHFTSKGIEEVRSKLVVSLSISNLSSCLSIQPKDIIMLTTCPFNTGYDMFPQNFSGQYNFGGYPNGYGGAPSGYAFGGGVGFPDQQTYPPYGQGYGITGGAVQGQTDPNFRQFDPYQQQFGYGTGRPPYIVPEGQPQNGQQGFSPLWQSPGQGVAMFQSQGPPPFIQPEQNQLPQQGQLPNTFQPNYFSPFNRTYPFNNLAQPYYAGDVYSQFAGSRFGCGQGDIRITNTCASPVEVFLNPVQGVILSKQQAVIPKGKQEGIFVKPSYFLGVYPVEIAARLQNSDQPPELVSKITVVVENELTQSYRDCISISPARKLSFNNFFGKPVTLEVINSCYNQGVRLLRSNDTVFFPASVLRAPTDIPNSGRHEMVENWALLDEVFQTGPDGRTTQVQKFEIFKALKNYCNQAPAFPRPDLQSPFQVIGNLRYFFSQGYYSVQSRTNMVVNFFTPFGTKQSINFPLILEDWWEALPFAERVVSYGDPTLRPAQCVNTDVLNFDNKYGGCLPEAELDLLEGQGFSTSQTGKLMKTSYPVRQTDTCVEYLTQQAPQTARGIGQQQGQSPQGQQIGPGVGAGKLEQGGCGSVDTISDIAPVVIEKSGVRLSLTSSDGREIKMNVDASDWRAAGKPEVKIDEKVFMTVTRLVPAGSERVSIPVRFCLQGTKGVVPDGNVTPPIDKPGEVQACGVGGDTGEGVFTKYGFDKLKFDWRFGEIKKDECNSSNASGIFCDATQFSISLLQKADEIKELIKVAVEERGKKCGAEEGVDCKELENSAEIYRFLSDSQPVTDDAAGKNYKYFIVGGKLVENTKAKERIAKKTGIEDLKKSLGEITITESNQVKVISDTKSLLDNLSKEPEASEIILQFNNNAQTLGKEEYKEQREEIGLDKFGETKFIMTLAEFRQFYLNLDTASREGAANCATPPGNINCNIDDSKVNIAEIKKGKGDGTLVTAQFLQDFANSLEDVVVAVRNAKEVSDEKKLAVMEKIQNLGALTGYANLAEFYAKHIDFNASLIIDGYTLDFREDFDLEFVDATEPKLADWEFLTAGKEGEETHVLPDTGIFEVTIKHEFEPPKNEEPEKGVKALATVSFKLVKRLSDMTDKKYSENPLFFMPLNGLTGLPKDETQFDRKGYGTVFIKGDGIPAEFSDGVLTFNDYRQEKRFNPQTYLSGSSTGVQTLSVNFRNTFEPANNGQVLSIDVAGKSIEFFPTDPIAMQVTLRKTSAESQPIGFLYSLKAGKEAVSAKKLFAWSVENDSVSGQPKRTIEDAYMSAQELCGTGLAQFNGVKLGGGKTGTITLRTLFFVPVRAFGVPDSMLSIVCFKDTSTESKFVDFGAASGARPLEKGENTLNPEDKARLVETYTLNSLLDRIRNKSICTEVSQKKLKLYWNHEPILDSLK